MANCFGVSRIVRWCPGCGDYAILKYLQQALAESGYHPEEVVIISGIGCSSRLPFYMNTHGFHTIHGRAPTIATGLALTRPDLKIIVITGDGDGLSIGLHHLIHLVRRNVDLTVIMANNQIYGLTKGQSSPTSEIGQKTKTAPQGVQQQPLSALKVLKAAGATWLGRSFDVQEQVLVPLIQKALQHQGTSFIEVYQGCPIFNREAFAQHGKPRDPNNPDILLCWPGQPLHTPGLGYWHFSTQGWQLSQEISPTYSGSGLEAEALIDMSKPCPIGLLYEQQSEAMSPTITQQNHPMNGYQKITQTFSWWDV
jgi:2-oxoglutarate ferredoxin oxidoreductase subunit beta